MTYGIASAYLVKYQGVGINDYKEVTPDDLLRGVTSGSSRQNE